MICYNKKGSKSLNKKQIDYVHTHVKTVSEYMFYY
jgi:hypothetical protein